MLALTATAARPTKTSATVMLSIRSARSGSEYEGCAHSTDASSGWFPIYVSIGSRAVRTRALVSACSGKLRLQVIRQPQSQRDQRQRRIRGAAGRERRGPGDVQVAEPVKAAVAIDDALSGALVHPRRAHVVPTAA